jgi:hypothetical protein
MHPLAAFERDRLLVIHRHGGEEKVSVPLNGIGMRVFVFAGVHVDYSPSDLKIDTNASGSAAHIMAQSRCSTKSLRRL